jgi:serine/threonine protein kinase
LLDFGAARRSADDVDQTFTVILKPGYAPVEQYANDSSIQQGPWTDIYGLAALCYFIITKRTPITSVTRLMRDQLIPLAEQNIYGFDSKFLKLIDWGMAVKPEDRPQSISEYRDQFNAEINTTSSRVKQAEKLEIETQEEKKSETLTSKFLKKQDKPASTIEFSELKSASEAVLPITALPVSPPKNAAINSATDKSIIKTDDEPKPKLIAKHEPKSEPKLESKSPENSLKNWKTYAVAAALFMAVFMGFTAQFSSKKSDNPAVVSIPPKVSSIAMDNSVNPTIAEPDKKPQIANVQDSLGLKEVIVAPSSSLNTAFPFPATVNNKDSSMVGPVKPISVQGFVQINVIPWGKVFVNDVFVGVTPPLRRLPLNIGVHKITLRNEGFPDVIQSVTVKQDQSVKITHDFN